MRRLLDLLCWSLIITVAPSQVAAQPQPLKPAWAWTATERLTARFDASGRRERNSPEVLGAYGVSFGSPTEREVIIGRRNPELFMPWELFDAFVMNGFVRDTSHSMERHYRLAAMRAGLYLPADFFERIRTSSSDYINTRLRVADLEARARRAARTDEKVRLLREAETARGAVCGLRASALAASRKTFGAALDRFLYVAVAPDQVASSTSPISAQRHREIEQGCP